MTEESRSASGRITEPWGSRTPYGAGENWPVRLDSHLADGPGTVVDRRVPTASNLHSNGDAMELAVRDGRLVGVRGIAGDRVNRGRLDVKDLYGWKAVPDPHRPRARTACGCPRHVDVPRGPLAHPGRQPHLPPHQ